MVLEISIVFSVDYPSRTHELSIVITIGSLLANAGESTEA